MQKKIIFWLGTQVHTQFQLFLDWLRPFKKGSRMTTQTRMTELLTEEVVFSISRMWSMFTMTCGEQQPLQTASLWLWLLNRLF